MAWIDTEDLDGWVEVINYEGDFLGWILSRDARHLNIPLHIVETPPFYKEHPFIVHHAIMTQEMGILKADEEAGMSEVQTVLMISNIKRKYEQESKLREYAFEENLFINDREAWGKMNELKRQDEFLEGEAIIEERVPENLEEFLAALGAFEEEVEEAEDEFGDGGWLSSVLNDEELGEMGE